MQSSNNFCELCVWAENVYVWTWTIIWMWNLFIVTATNSFCQTKLKATKAGSVTCCCTATWTICVVHIFNILKNARKKNTLQQQQCLVVTFIYSFSLLILLYIDIIFHSWKHIRDFCGESRGELGDQEKNLKFISG